MHQPSRKARKTNTYRENGGGLRERPLDKVSSVDGMTMTPLWKGRASQGHHSRELLANLQQQAGKDGKASADESLMTVDFFAYAFRSKTEP